MENIQQRVSSCYTELATFNEDCDLQFESLNTKSETIVRTLADVSAALSQLNQPHAAPGSCAPVVSASTLFTGL